MSDAGLDAFADELTETLPTDDPMAEEVRHTLWIVRADALTKLLKKLRLSFTKRLSLFRSLPHPTLDFAYLLGQIVLAIADNDVMEVLHL